MKISLFHNIIDIIFPENCPGCGRYEKRIKYCFCKSCIAQITPAPSQNDNFFSLAMYEGPVKNAIQSLKYGKRKWIAKSLAEWINDFLNQHKEIEFDLIIPVPLHPLKEFQRSFNQSWLIAYSLGKLQKKTAIYNCVKKIKNNRSQTDLDNVERKENVKNVYRVTRNTIIKKRSILIIDDVYTTGATVNEVSRILRETGAEKIIILTVART